MIQSSIKAQLYTYEEALTILFFPSLQCISMEQVPPVKSFAVSQVSLPSQPYLTQDNHVVALKSFFQSKTL